MVRQKISILLETGRSKSKRHISQRPYLLPILGLLIGVAIVSGVVFTRHGQTLRVSAYHVVFLSDRSQQKTLDTKAKTVGELLDSMPSLDLSKADVIEPARNTPIVEDNYRINIYRARPVTVIDHGHKIVTLTAERSARVVAQNAGLKLFPEDVASFVSGDIRTNTIGEEVEVDRSVPVVLNLYGEPIVVHTTAKTVNDLLVQRGVILAKKDTLKPAATTRIKPMLQIFVIRNGTRVVTESQSIPAPTQYVTDPSLSFGATAIRQKGTPGKRSVTYQITTVRGISHRKIIQSVVVVDPVPQIVARGNVVDVGSNKQAIMAAAGISSGDYGYVNYVISRESNWNPAAVNGGGCLGLGQACPGSKLTAVCSLSDPVCELKYFTGYANGRYGGWGGAYNFWTSHGYW